MKKTKLILMIIAVIALMTALAVFASAADYCAVGEVKDGKAAILKADGTTAVVTFDGTAPAADSVCSYNVSGDKYTFTPVSLTDYSSWRVYDVNGGGIFYGNDGTNEFRLSYEGSAAFLKTGTFKWKAANSNQIIIADGVGDYPNTGWPSNLFVADDDGNNVFDVIYGDGQATVSSGLDPKAVLCTGAAEKELLVTESGSAPETPSNKKSGVCAIGEIDAENKKAAVLFKDGSIETVVYEGDVTPDTICTFSVNSDKYTFTPVSLSDYSSWRVYDVNGGGIFYGNDGTNEYRLSYEGSAAFLKTGTNKWKVAKKNQVVIAEGVGDYPNTGWPSNLFVADVDGDGVFDVIYGDGQAAVSSGLDPKTILATGSAAYDVKIGVSQSAPTADILSVVAIAAIVSVSGAALLISKKH